MQKPQTKEIEANGSDASSVMEEKHKHSTKSHPETMETVETTLSRQMAIPQAKGRTINKSITSTTRSVNKIIVNEKIRKKQTKKRSIRKSDKQAAAAMASAIDVEIIQAASTPASMLWKIFCYHTCGTAIPNRLGLNGFHRILERSGVMTFYIEYIDKGIVVRFREEKKCCKINAVELVWRVFHNDYIILIVGQNFPSDCCELVCHI